jgi:hypothetical protein
VRLSASILNYDQPESLALLPGERRLPPFSVYFVLDVRGRERRDPASVTALPQTIDAVDTAVHMHVRDFARQKRPRDCYAYTTRRPWHRIREERIRESDPDLTHSLLSQPTMPAEDGVHVQRRTSARSVRVFGNCDDLLLETLHFLVGALAWSSRQVKLCELHAQGFLGEYQKIRRFRVSGLAVW